MIIRNPMGYLRGAMSVATSKRLMTNQTESVFVSVSGLNAEAGDSILRGRAFKETIEKEIKKWVGRD